MTDTIRLTDLAKPTFTPEAQMIIDGMAAMADYCPLTTEALHEQAAAQTGLNDFGNQDYRERMAVLLEAFHELPRFTAFGRTYAFSLMLTFLKGRLRVIDHLKNHPEIFDINIEAPLVIAGLPRTGTTHLHSLLAADPALRSLPYWEAQEPLPAPGEEGTIEPRRQRTGDALNISNTLMPYFTLMHEMTTDHIHEDIGLMVQDFASGFFTTLTHLPRWSDYLRDNDQTSGYQFLRMMLQVLAHQDGCRPPLGAQVAAASRAIHPNPQGISRRNVHRDASRSRRRRGVDGDDDDLHHAHERGQGRRAYGGQVLDHRIHEMLSACMRDHDRLPAERTIDVRFDEFMADDLAMAQRVWDMAGYSHSPDPKGRSRIHGRPRTRTARPRGASPRGSGLDKDELAAGSRHMSSGSWTRPSAATTRHTTA